MTNWKYVKLHCPHCGYEHEFKRACWWSVEGFYLGLYDTNDQSSRKSCRQSLLYGEADYEVAKKVIEGGSVNYDHPKTTT
jgi:hypothetical protein